MTCAGSYSVPDPSIATSQRSPTKGHKLKYTSDKSTEWLQFKQEGIDWRLTATQVRALWAKKAEMKRE